VKFKQGKLVKRINNWVKYNSWMADLYDYDEYGIIIKAPKQIKYKPCIEVLWATLGVMNEHPDDIEVLDSV